jgi:hypothetical protein
VVWREVEIQVATEVDSDAPVRTDILAVNLLVRKVADRLVETYMQPAINECRLGHQPGRGQKREGKQRGSHDFSSRHGAG